MLNAIIRFSIRNKLIIGLFTLGWIIWGAIELIKLPVDALPDITSNQVQLYLMMTMIFTGPGNK